ncbi:hypothetical protein [Rhodococcus sp. HM1]|nr:hypothetical protein [Rhodococcus sp. HM1]
MDFQHIPTGGFFAECTQPNRSGYTAADARTYAVRIYPTCT